MLYGKLCERVFKDPRENVRGCVKHTEPKQILPKLCVLFAGGSKNYRRLIEKIID
jgi:hypothetical protein